MNITIQLTDEQANQLAEQIKAGAPSPAQFQIEVGKRYVRRDGSISGKIESHSLGPKGHQFYDGKFHYMPDGHGFSDLKDNDIDLVCEHVEAPTLPEPPEGFHPAIMGPIAFHAYENTHDIALWDTKESKWDHTKWAGSLPQIYALRIGSDIARLNGLGLKLELSRTYATNSGEIVEMNESQGFSEIFKSSKRKGEWNSIGQALIDGVAQPLDHPDSIKEEIPADNEPERKAREWDASVSKVSGRVYHRLDGDSSENWDLIRVREILPGEPTIEQISDMIEALECARLEKIGWIDAVETALAPFRKP